MIYTSPLPYVPHRLRVAAIYCSDGRVGELFDDFLANGLHLPHYDRLAFPGGPACLAGPPAAFVQQAGAAEALKFLVDVHELERVVLIQHQGCGFYQATLQLPEDEVEQQQRVDAAIAAAKVREVTGLDRVETWFLRNTDGEITFEPIGAR